MAAARGLGASRRTGWGLAFRARARLRRRASIRSTTFAGFGASEAATASPCVLAVITRRSLLTSKPRTVSSYGTIASWVGHQRLFWIGVPQARWSSRK